MNTAITIVAIGFAFVAGFGLHMMLSNWKIDGLEEELLKERLRNKPVANPATMKGYPPTPGDYPHRRGSDDTDFGY
jgi:hypothetical protein